MSPLLRRYLGRWQRVPGILVLGLTLLLPALSALGVERFPPPELDPTTYTMPQTTTPPARAHFMEYVDVFLLLSALSLASYLVLVKRRRKYIFWLMVGSLLYFGFYRKGCVCPIGSIQNVTLALFNTGYAVPASVVLFFLLPLGFTLFFGRSFCAAVCPLGAAQDVVLWKPVKIKPWLEHALGLIPYVYLGAAVLFAATGSAFLICEYDPFVAFFRRGGSLMMLGIGAAFLIVGMFIGRPYCRFFCPYGAILSLLSRVSKWNVYLTPEDCIRCEICEVACPFGAIAQPSEKEPAEKVRTKRGLVMAFCLLPILVFAGGWLGGQLSIPLSKMNRTVRLAERLAAEETGKIKLEPAATNSAAPAAVVSTKEKNSELLSKAFRQTGQAPADTFTQAFAVRGQFALGGWIMGAFVGLVLGSKLISLFSPPKRSIYEPDRATCIACGRCYSYCPKELVKVKRAEKKKTEAAVPVSPSK